MNFKIIEIAGKDAQDFLQRLTTASVAALPMGQGTTGLLLTGTGKVFADFFILIPALNRVLLAVDKALADPLIAELEKMHFSEDITMQILAGNALIQRGGEEFTRPFPLTQTADQLLWPLPVSGFSACFGQKHGPGFSHSEWERARILARVPKRDQEWTQGDTSALDCGFLPWIDRAKGCYPGQEAVERALNVGHPARALILLESSVLLTPGDELLSEERCGKVTSVAPKEEQDGCLALGIVQWNKREQDFFTIEGKGTVKCLK